MTTARPSRSCTRSRAASAAARCAASWTKIDRAVLVADVRALPVQLRRVVLGEEDGEQLLVGDALRVVGDLDDLGVARAVAADLLVGRVRGRAARIADRVALTPSSRRNAASTPQKQPAPNVAFASIYSSSSRSAAELMQ